MLHQVCFIFPGSSGFLKAVKAFQNGEYTDIIELCTEEIDTNGIFLPPALLMRASFLLLKGQAVEAKPDLDKLIAMEDSDKKVSLRNPPPPIPC